MALSYAAHLWNITPRENGGGLSPMEVFSSSKFDHPILQGTHVWGCPTYVLDPTLQDGKKLPKWKPRSRRGKFVGISHDHSTNVCEILNLTTLTITPQYHVVYDDFFTTVHCKEEEVPPIWPDLLQFHSENALPIDAHPPPLADEWLDEDERPHRAAPREIRSPIDEHQRELGTPRQVGTPNRIISPQENSQSRTTPRSSAQEGAQSQDTFSPPSTSSTPRTLTETTGTPGSPARHGLGHQFRNLKNLIAK
ncbi:MAG: hypothetical protein ACREOZ_04145 [Gloeomargaritales cyanobacterium]